ncbi:MAG: DUF1328 domain-containing protein [Proteobacteria bacterium]|jgi:uncharacterized membrane protein YtjA (UPF0391 family)|nr:DUF1328 domain-containing protein [Pseudomonadota bacterium]
MVFYILVFFSLAVISALLGFGKLAGTFSQIAKILSVIFLILFIISFIRHMT